MKQLLHYKRIDLYLQLAAFILPWLLYLTIPAAGRAFQLDHLLTSYCVIGLVQIASWLINRFRLPAQYQVRSRKWYERSLMVLILLIPAGMMLKVLLFVFVVLLYASPLMAFWYLAITIAEFRKMQHHIPNIDTDITETHLQ